MPERDQVGPPELGRLWPHAAVQEGLQAPATRRPVPAGAAALGVVRPQEEADGERRERDQSAFIQTGYYLLFMAYLIFIFNDF